MGLCDVIFVYITRAFYQHPLSTPAKIPPNQRGGCQEPARLIDPRSYKVRVIALGFKARSSDPNVTAFSLKAP